MKVRNILEELGEKERFRPEEWTYVMHYFLENMAKSMWHWDEYHDYLPKCYMAIFDVVVDAFEHGWDTPYNHCHVQFLAGKINENLAKVNVPLGSISKTDCQVLVDELDARKEKARQYRITGQNKNPWNSSYFFDEMAFMVNNALQCTKAVVDKRPSYSEQLF